VKEKLLKAGVQPASSSIDEAQAMVKAGVPAVGQGGKEGGDSEGVKATPSSRGIAAARGPLNRGPNQI
jgi:hypothetical protein